MADYAISNVPRRVVYAASGTGPYAFTFEILNQTDIAVYKASTLLTLTTDYTVTINANGTGSVTLVTSAGTSNITIVGAKNIQRTTDFTTGGDLFANTLNDELDNQTIFIQQVAETAERGLKAPVVDPTDINMTLPAKASRVGTVLAFNATTGNPEAGPSIASVTTVAAQSANINTVAANIASVNTVSGNITNVNTVAGVSSNVTAVANNIANVNAVGADLLEGTSEINTVAVDIANVNTVGTNIASVNTVAGEIGAGQDVTVVAANLSGADTIGTVATNIANVNATGTNIANVNAVGADLLEAVSEINTVATDITNVNTVGTNIASVNTVAGISGAVSTVSGIAANVTTVAGISPNVTTVAGISGNVTTVAGISGNVTTVAGISSDVTIAAANVADINNFADVYQGAKATDPTLRNDGSALQSGDLYFNTTDDVMKVREAGAWLAAYASLSGALIAVNNLSDVASASSARTNLGLGTIATQAASSVAITGGSINGTTVGATTASTGRFSTLEATGVATVSAGTVSAPSITTTGDTNTGIFFPAADTIAFTEGGVESMRIDANGNLGLGVTPTNVSTYKNLEVRGSTGGLIYSSNADGSVKGYFGNTSSTVFLNSITSHPLLFGTADTERMRIDSSGNVGIGTSSPSLKLDVIGGIRVNEDGAGTKIVQIRSNWAGVDPAINVQTNHPLLFNTNGTERMRIDPNGNVGIGVTPQTWYLNSSVYGALQFGAGALFYGRTTSSSVNLELSTNSYLDSSAAYRYLFTGEASRYNQASGAHIWSSAVSGTAGNSFTYSERMRIDSSGNVLVGTTVTDPTFSRSNGVNISAGSILSRSAAGFDIGLSVTSGNNINFYTDNGSSRVSAGFISSNGGTSTYATSSDYRMKEDVQPITNALNAVMQLKPVNYKWKLEFAGTKINGQGFIAHELQAVVPDCVTGEKDAVDKDGKPVYQGIDTSFLVATLTAAIQELKTELDSVKAELQTLKGN